MKKVFQRAVLAVIVAVTLPSPGHGHCQIPCGIYDDAARIERMYEDVQTIEKGMQMIMDLAGKTDPQSANQLTRWIMNKEEHAANIISTIAEYFLTQKVKVVAPDTDGYGAYLSRLADHHRVMVAAMKAKQSADLADVAPLRDAIAAVAKHYDTEPPRQGAAQHP